jgi:hypothetical protein
MASMKVLSQNLSKGTSENHQTQDFWDFKMGLWNSHVQHLWESKIETKIDWDYLCLLEVQILQMVITPLLLGL